MSRLLNLLSVRVSKANETMPIAAIDNRKKVSEIADACVAYLMNIALEPKNIDATNRTAKPVGC
jgi:hypothetical protein